MEKCTYCVQRINEARIEAKRRTADPRRRGGHRLPGACPTRRSSSATSTIPEPGVPAQGHPLNYGLLAELNTVPRTTYLARSGTRTRSWHGGHAEPKVDGIGPMSVGPTR
jgi:hypothetical protein